MDPSGLVFVGKGDVGCARAPRHANVVRAAQEWHSATGTDIRMSPRQPLGRAGIERGGSGYCSRVTCTSTNIREVPEPEKMPESGLTSL